MVKLQKNEKATLVTDQPMAPRGRDTDKSRDNKNTIKKSSTALS